MMLKHNYHIEDLGRPHGWFRARRYRYTCIRCGWAFMVENWSGTVSALGPGNQPLPGPEGMRRLATFADGPCEPPSDRRPAATASKPPSRKAVGREGARILDPE
jgi:hypothetical protein